MIRKEVYRKKGYTNRDDDLYDLSVEYGVPEDAVLAIAEVLGPDEDFDGLVSSLEDAMYSGWFDEMDTEETNMSRWPTRQEVEQIRARYKAGRRIELVRMDDPQAPPAGTRGTVLAVDDAGDLIVDWDNGCGLKLVPGVDGFRVLPDEPRAGGNA